MSSVSQDLLDTRFLWGPHEEGLCQHPIYSVVGYIIPKDLPILEPRATDLCPVKWVKLIGSALSYTVFALATLVEALARAALVAFVKLVTFFIPKEYTFNHLDSFLFNGSLTAFTNLYISAHFVCRIFHELFSIQPPLLADSTLQSMGDKLNAFIAIRINGYAQLTPGALFN